MSGHVTMKVEGLREMEKALVEMSKAAPGIIAKALRDPMQKVLADAQALVPKRTGELHDALTLTMKRANATRASMADTLSEVGLKIAKPNEAKVGTWARGQGSAARLNPRYYWHLVEFGTAHSAAHPYIRPAFDQNTDHLIGQFKSIAREQIERTATRYAKRRARGKR